MQLVITEKPSVARSISEVIGATEISDGYMAVSYTHLTLPTIA